MHLELTEEQVLYIEAFLSSKHLEYTPLEEELLDHLCCMVETELKTGKDFHSASETVFDTFRKDELQELQDQTIRLLNQKSLLMKKISFLVLGLLLATFTVVWSMEVDPPSTYPLGKKFEVSSNFGMRLHPIQKKRKMHLGIDFRAPIGTPVYATADGVIEKAVDTTKGYGKHVMIKHDESFQSLYAQLSEINVKPGQAVKKGDIIGLTGSSGASTGPHLHYEVLKDGKRVDPVNYFGP